MSAFGERLGKRLLYPYGLIILGGWLFFAVIFLRHLLTGAMPDNVAFSLIGLDVYWYGVIITSGIALGAAVIARLVAERGAEQFQNAVPASLQTEPISTLDLPPDLEHKLTRRGFATVGLLLRQWGHQYRALPLDGAELETVHHVLTEHPDIPATWLHDAPWRQDDPEHIWNGIFWVLILGIIGARLYHVFTPPPSMAAMGIESAWDYFRNPEQLLNLRRGGLGIYGGLAGGGLGIWLYTRRHRLDLLRFTDLAVMGAALGQSIGRWGNFFNQELYGRPTTLPWAITIDPVHRLPGYAEFSRFHPAFLYESLWSLLAFLVLITLATHYRKRIRPGELTALYLIFYAAGRTLVELVRLDSRVITIGGVELQIAVATLVSLGVALLMALWIVWGRMRRTGDNEKEAGSS